MTYPKLLLALCLSVLLSCVVPAGIGEQQPPTQEEPTAAPNETENDDRDAGAKSVPSDASTLRPVAPDEPDAGPATPDLGPTAPSDGGISTQLEPDDDRERTCTAAGCEPCQDSTDCPLARPICAARICRICYADDDCPSGELCREDGYCEPLRLEEDESEELEEDEGEEEDDDDDD